SGAEGVPGASVQGAVADAVASAHIGAGGEQPADTVAVAAGGGNHQRGGVIGQALFDVGTVLEQGVDNRAVAGDERGTQGGDARWRVGVDLGAMNQQFRQHLPVAATGGADQGGAALAVARSGV